MRNRKTAAIILISVFLSVLQSCTSYAGLYQQDDMVNLLENSGTKPEFVADGVYYCMPCNITEFIENGWSVGEVVFESGERYYIEEYLMEGRSYDADKVKRLDELTCPGDSTMEVTLFKPGQTTADDISLTYYYEEKILQLTLINSSSIPFGFRDCKVLSAAYSGKEASDFVTWYGICCETSRKTIYKLAEKNHLGYEIETRGVGLFHAEQDNCYLSTQDGERMVHIAYLDYGRTIKSIRVFVE